MAVNPTTGYPLFAGALHLGAGLAVGLCSLAAGIAIGQIGDAGVRAYLKQNRLFIGLILMLIFTEVLGLYGLLTAVLMHNKASSARC